MTWFTTLLVAVSGSQTLFYQSIAVKQQNINNEKTPK